MHALSGYSQPSWKQTVAVLSNKTPANPADLHALILEQLRELQIKVSWSSSDSYKGFWNEDSHGKPTKPKVEESCRDRVIELLEPVLKNFGVRRDPEAHLALDKRADIMFSDGDNHSVPLEAKRDTNDELWTACEEQLEKHYARDPNASGFGIYLVFWFGDMRNGTIPKHPDGAAKPTSPGELKLALEEAVKPQERERLSVFVLDVSRPD